MSQHLSAEDVRALVEGRPPVRGDEAARQHLDGCDSCRERLAEARAGDGATEVSGEVALPEGADRSVVAPQAGRYAFRRSLGGALEELGRGGFGKVVLARDTTLGRDVAMKRLTSERLSRARETSEARLLREARVMGQLEHPAIVPLHELGRGEDGQLYYTMRRIRGRTLADALAEATTLDARLRLLPHMLTACHAVAYAHSRGVVHRDLKPHNVMLDRFGATYLIDWGLARAKDLDASDEKHPADESGALRLVTSDETIGDEGGRIGTAAYMSPEHIEGPRSMVDELSDVWALGAMLYHVLTGHPPRNRSTLEWKRPPPPVSAVAPDVPKDLAALCDKAMAERRADRYPSAEALAADLDAWLHGRPVSAHDYRPRELLQRFVRANRVAVLVASAALATLLVLGVTAYLRLRTERNQSRVFAHLILDQVLERLSTAQDDEFTRHLIDQTKTWLDTYGAGDDAASVAWAYFLLAREGYHADQPTADLVEACLRAARGVDEVRARAAVFGCRALRGSGELSNVSVEDLNALKALELEVPQGAEADSAPWIEARVVLAYRQSLIANSLMKLPEELSFVDRLLALSRRSLSDASDRAGALARVARALARRSLVASSLGDGKSAVRFGDEAVAVARQALALRADYFTLEVLSDNLAQLGMMRRWHPGDVAGGQSDEALRDETRRVFQARLVVAHDSVMARVGYSVFLLELDEPEEAWRQLRDVPWTSPSAILTSQFGFAALATGHEAEVLKHADTFRAEPDLDCQVVLALALALSGHLVDGAERLDYARTLPMVSGWPAATMTRFGKELRGPLAPGIAHLVENFAKGQYANDDSPYIESMDRVAKEWRAMAAAAK